MVNKKGVMFSTIIIIVIALVSTYLVVELFRNHFERVDDMTDVTLCAQTLRAQKFSESITFFKSFKNQCHTMIANPIPSKHMETKDQVMRQLADYMVDMWDMTGRGQIKGMWSGEGWKQVFGADSCLILYQIPIEKKGYFLTEDAITMEDFDTFLYTNFKDAKKKLTYEEYFRYAGNMGSYIVGPLVSAGEEKSLDECKRSWEEDDIFPKGCGYETIEPGRVYVISVASPQTSKIVELFGGSDGSNVITFSTEDFALEQGCKVI